MAVKMDLMAKLLVGMMAELREEQSVVVMDVMMDAEKAEEKAEKRDNQMAACLAACLAGSMAVCLVERRADMRVAK